MKKRTVYVTGDRRPDTDTICSVAGLTLLRSMLQDLGRTGLMSPSYQGEVLEEICYKAVRCSQIPARAEAILQRFGIDAPVYLDDVRTQILDIDYSKADPVSEGTSLLDAWNIMKETDKATLAVVDEQGNLSGVITKGDIAKSYMEVFDNRILGEAGTCVRNIVSTLRGELVTGDLEKRITEGKVLIASANTEVFKARTAPGDIVILGNRYEAQLAAIEQGASVIIADNDAPISRTIRKLALEAGTVIIRTPCDAYDTSRLISQSMPVRHFMTRNPICFRETDYIDDIRETMLDRSLRDFPVLDEEGRYLGTISRRNLIDMDKKQIIMVNHNSARYAVKGLGEAQIIEIVDHHRLHTAQTVRPLIVCTRPAGSTAAIVASLFEENGLDISPDMAGMLCCAICAATDGLDEEKAYETDRRMALKLAKAAKIDLQEECRACREDGMRACESMTGEEGSV